MKTKKFKSLFEFAEKSRVLAGEGLEKGAFPFFTSSSVQKKRIDGAQYNFEALIFGTGGSASVHFDIGPFGTSTDCIVAYPDRSKELINPKYVYYYLIGNIHLLERGFKGAGLKHISKKYIENLDIPILSIEIQNKIVAVLDKANTILEKRKSSFQLFDEYLKAAFWDMFGDLFKNDKKWNLEIIDKLCNIQGGLQITPKRNHNPIEMPYLRVANIFRGSYDLTEIKTLQVTQSEKERILLRKNDIFGPNP
jgi:type I restriction enzyme, S subunit